MRFSQVLGVVALALAALPASAATILSADGTFVQDDSMAIFTFTISTLSDVHIYTLSYAGSSGTPTGTNAAGNVVAPGGFAPVLSLFSQDTGALLKLSAPVSMSGSCMYCAKDPDTGAYWDADIQIKLDPGTYILVLTEDDNTPAGYFYSDGFKHQYDEEPWVTGPYFTGNPDSGPFWDNHPDQRDSHWAVDVMTAPEPAAFWLCAMGILAALLFRRVPARERVRVRPVSWRSGIWSRK
jgi:hypothetical protein